MDRKKRKINITATSSEAFLEIENGLDLLPDEVYVKVESANREVRLTFVLFRLNEVMPLWVPQDPYRIMRIDDYYLIIYENYNIKIPLYEKADISEFRFLKEG